eukprot:TRINITY_DN33327_c0_g1_i1.p1 TRINITY_DN33327_c0_g1~~TRINITY_DN33327_c0_g1_i1.p1  ORF type:complete len:631 (+),score=118.78 TRINITY_DN33327_c0_g1_i1:222-2114(+)
MSVASASLEVGHQYCSHWQQQKPEALSLDSSPRSPEADEDDAHQRLPLALPLEVSPPSLLDHVLEMVRAGVLASPGDAEASSLAAGTCGSGSMNLPEVAKLDFPYFEQTFSRVQLLGRGAFGEVWNCKSLKDGQDYAVKIVRFRGRGSAGAHVERHVIREAQTLALMSHENVIRYHHAWVETDERGCGGGDAAPGDASCSTRAPSWPSTPATPFAPPPSPAVRPRMPTIQLPEVSPLTEGSKFSYDGSSCGSGGMVFFEWNEEDAASEAAFGSSASGRDGKGSHSPDTDSGDEVPAVLPGSLARARSSDRHLEDPDAYLEYTGTMYLQVELCKDTTLQGWIADRNWRVGADNRGRCPWAQKAFTILLQCVRALAHIHSRSCVHRDVKPANILFSHKDSAVRLADFGLAKVLDSTTEISFCAGSPSPSPSRPGGRGSRGTVGTPSYASPEQLAGRQVDTSTDVYSLGLVLAEIICPVQTQMERAAVLEGLRHKRQLPAQAVKDFPVLADLAVRMTDHDPSKRPTANDLLKVAQKVYVDVRRKRRSRGVETGPGGVQRKPMDLATFLQGSQKTTSPSRHRHRWQSKSQVAGQFAFIRHQHHRQSLSRHAFRGLHFAGPRRGRVSSEAKAAGT